MAKDLTPEPIEDAIARGDNTIRFECANGRETGPYDLDGFKMFRPSDGEAYTPLRIRVEGQTIIATYAMAVKEGDRA